MKRLAIALASVCLAGCGHVTERSTHIGTIIQASDSGIFHKTHEIEVVRGGMNGGSGNFSTSPFFATVNDEVTWGQAQQYMDRQQEVKVSATCVLFAPWSSDNWDDSIPGSCFVTSIAPK